MLTTFNNWGEKDKMKNKEMYDIGKRIGLDRKDIESVLKNKITCCAIATIPMLSNIYKDGTYYGTISIYDF
jgi:hypothetical protein